MKSRGGHVELVDLRKRFDDVVAVDGISLDIPAGEFFSLLGPSGCGKTTTLRLIGGFERPDEGRILLDGDDMAQTPPHRRPVNTVFQSYALFPHLSVRDNVAFGLRFRRASKSETEERVAAALDLVQLGALGARMPGQLSGGQQQRVALARALVLDPEVLLLDEPLGALDAKLRKALQLELKAIQERVGITFVYVTHDQEEALTMSDRVAVMSEGRVAQVGSPREVYDEPADAYVADFLGVSNLMDTRALGPAPGGGCRVAIGDFELVAGSGPADASGDAKVAIRPERIGLEAHGATGENRLPGMVERTVFLGAVTHVIIGLPEGRTLQAMLRGGAPTHEQGTPVVVHLPREALRVLPARTAEADPQAAAAR